VLEFSTRIPLPGNGSATSPSLRHPGHPHLDFPKTRDRMDDIEEPNEQQPLLGLPSNQARVDNGEPFSLKPCLVAKTQPIS
jgi:hypothetical protein